jgi:hypothetical protein
VHVVALALSLVGISIGWLPGIGWLGFALAAAALAIGAVGISGRKTRPADLGYDAAGNGIAGFALPWIAALQIKSAGGALDALLIPWPLARLVACAGAAFGAFWIAILLGRLKLRAPLVAIAIAAIAVLAATGASAWTAADRAKAYAFEERSASPPSP